MSDDDRIRSLLTLAADLPDDVQPPVTRLLGRARHRRRLRAAASAAGAAAVVAAAFTLPAALGSFSNGLAHGRAPSGIVPRLGVSGPAGPTAAQLARFRWSSLPPSPLGPQPAPLLAWTGRDLVELAGPGKDGTTASGAAYSPGARRWHRITPPPNAVGLAGAVTVWTGHQLFMTNNTVPSYWIAGVGAPAGLYDPAADRWTATDLPVQFLGASSLTAVWTGRDIVVAGTSRGRVVIAAYDPGTGHWQVSQPVLPARHPARYVAMVAAPGRLLVWSLWDRVRTYRNGASDHAGIDVLSASRDGSWHDVTGRWPQNESVTAPAFTGQVILLSPSSVWCGRICSPPAGGERSGYIVNPRTLARNAIPPGPLGVTDPAFIWTGRAIIAMNRYDDITGPGSRGIRPDDMALYDPGSRRWLHLAAPPGHPTLPQTPVWTDRQLLALTSAGALWTFHR